MESSRVILVSLIACLLLDSCYAPCVPSFLVSKSTSAKRELKRIGATVRRLSLSYSRDLNNHQEIPSSLDRVEQCLTENLQEFRRILPNLSENTKRNELPRLLKRFENIEFNVYSKMWQHKDYVQYRQQYRDVLLYVREIFPELYQAVSESEKGSSLVRRRNNRILVERAYADQPNNNHSSQEVENPIPVEMPGAEEPSHIAYHAPF